MKKTLTWGMIMMIMLFSTACSEEPKTEGSEQTESSLTFTLDTYPIVDGSTVTIPLSENMASKLLNMSLEEAQQHVLHNTTHQAYVNLIEGKADIIFVTGPSEEELQLAEESQMELEVIPIVKEGFVFLVNEENPVEDLTLEEIIKIYSGEITNWSEVGGDDVPIKAYQRPVNSGSQTGMLELVMKEVPLMEAPTELVVAMMGELIDAVAAYNNEPDAIGYSYYYYVTDMWGQKETKLLKVNEVYPEPKTISSEEYPITTSYYAVIRKDEPADSNVRKMIQWILSDEGQKVAEEAGYVPLH